MGLALVCVLGLLMWSTVAGDDADASCPVAVSERDPRQEFVDRSSLLPQGSVGEDRQSVVEALEGLGPLGEVTAGRFYDSRGEAPAVVPYGDRLSLVSALEGRPATVSAVDLSAEPVPATDWSTQVEPSDQRWTTFTGGAVGEQWVAVFSGPAPALLTLGADGEEVVCRPLWPDGGGADVDVVTDQADEDVVVMASAVGAGWWFGRLDPGTGDQTAAVADQGQQTWEQLEIAGDLAVASRWRTSTIGTSGAPRPGDAEDPWVAAWDLEGKALWTYPAEGSRAFPAVLLGLGDDGTAYVVSFDRGGPWLDAVDADGARIWRQRLDRDEWSGSLWDDVVVTRSPDPAGGARLRAYGVDDGRLSWTVRARQAPGVGDDPRSGFGEPLTTSEAWWVPAPNGLLRIDRATGGVTREDSEARIDELVEVGDRLVVRSGPALLLTR